jgi:putative acetyltransferase
VTIPLAEPVSAASWTVRPEQPLDLDQIHDVHRAAFRGPNEAELVDAIRGGPNFVPELSLVAVAPDGSVLGHLLISVVAFEDAAGETTRSTVLALAPMAVLPAHHGRGIGTALILTALSVADGRPEPFVAVLGPPGYYERFGFRPAAEFDVHGPYDAAGDAFQLRPRGGNGGVPTGTVIYPPMFDGV